MFELKMIYCLLLNSPSNVTELAALLGKSKPQTERYLKILRSPVPDGYNMQIDWSRKEKKFEISGFGVFGNRENLLTNYEG